MKAARQVVPRQTTRNEPAAKAETTASTGTEEEKKKQRSRGWLDPIGPILKLNQNHHEESHNQCHAPIGGAKATIAQHRGFEKFAASTPNYERHPDHSVNRARIRALGKQLRSWQYLR